MPFTPFHFGPALLIGMVLLSLVDISTLFIASVILDLEPLVVMLFNLPFPLHGILHTYLAAFIVAISLAIVLWPFRGVLNAIVSGFGVQQESTFRSLLLASLLGTFSHIFLDSFLYAEMNPFYPLLGNPYFNLIPSQVIYNLCIFSGFLGLLVYVVYLLNKYFKSKNVKLSQNDLW